MSFRNIIAQKLKEKRPNLADSSLKTYVSMLFNLHKKVGGNETIDWFDKDDDIIEEIKDKPLATRKTLLSALFVLTGKSKFNEAMMKDCKEIHEMYKQNKKNEKQEQGWMTPEQIKAVYGDLEEKVKSMFSKKLLANYETINQYILLGCLGGVSGVIPRRSMDYTEMKIKNYNIKEDNFFKNGVFTFNKYKTSKIYGQQIFNVKEHAPDFNKIITRWAKLNPTDYLIFSSNQQKMTPSQVSRYLNKILDSPTSTNILRHIFITDKFGDKSKEMEQVAEQMSHSVSMQNEYIKY